MADRSTGERVRKFSAEIEMKALYGWRIENGVATVNTPRGGFANKVVRINSADEDRRGVQEELNDWLTRWYPTPTDIAGTRIAVPNGVYGVETAIRLTFHGEYTTTTPGSVYGFHVSDVRDASLLYARADRSVPAEHRDTINRALAEKAKREMARPRSQWIKKR